MKKLLLFSTLLLLACIYLRRQIEKGDKQLSPTKSIKTDSNAVKSSQLRPNDKPNLDDVVNDDKNGNSTSGP